MLEYENSENPNRENRNSISPWKDASDEYCAPSDEILSLGRSIMDYGIKAKDALHIACAVKSKCDFFITTDKKLLNKKVPNINIVSPIDFIKETEDI